MMLLPEQAQVMLDMVLPAPLVYTTNDIYPVIEYNNVTFAAGFLRDQGVPIIIRPCDHPTNYNGWAYKWKVIVDPDDPDWRWWLRYRRKDIDTRVRRTDNVEIGVLTQAWPRQVA